MTSAILGDVDSSVHEKIEEKSDSDENNTTQASENVDLKVDIHAVEINETENVEGEPVDMIINDVKGNNLEDLFLSPTNQVVLDTYNLHELLEKEGFPVFSKTDIEMEDNEPHMIVNIKSTFSDLDEANENENDANEMIDSNPTSCPFSTGEYGRAQFGMDSFLDWSEQKDRSTETTLPFCETTISFPCEQLPKHFVTKYLSLPYVSLINQNCEVNEFGGCNEIYTDVLNVVALKCQDSENLRQENDIQTDPSEFDEDGIIIENSKLKTPRYKVNARVDNNIECAKYRFNVWKIDPSSKTEVFSSVIERDHSDFIVFHHNLTTSSDIVAVIIPPLPLQTAEDKKFCIAKKYFESDELKDTIYIGNIIKDCCRLNWYMEKIITHPTLGQSSHLSKFLEQKEFNATHKQRAIIQKDKLIARVCNWLKKWWYRNRIEKNNLLLKEYEWACEYEKHIHSLKDSECKLIKAQTSLSNRVSP